MRTITDHKLEGLNEALTITVLDEPGQGGGVPPLLVSVDVEYSDEEAQ